MYDNNPTNMTGFKFLAIIRLPNTLYSHMFCQIALVRREMFEVMKEIREINESFDMLRRYTSSTQKLPKSLKIRYKKFCPAPLSA